MHANAPFPVVDSRCHGWLHSDSFLQLNTNQYQLERKFEPSPSSTVQATNITNQLFACGAVPSFSARPSFTSWTCGWQGWHGSENGWLHGSDRHLDWENVGNWWYTTYTHEIRINWEVPYFQTADKPTWFQLVPMSQMHMIQEYCTFTPPQHRKNFLACCHELVLLSWLGYHAKTTCPWYRLDLIA